MKGIINISSDDYWFKVVAMCQTNWALIDPDPSSSNCTVYFFHELAGVFDQMTFGNITEAIWALKRNGFRRFAEDQVAQSLIKPPKPPFYLCEHINGKIYSSGRFWR